MKNAWNVLGWPSLVLGLITLAIHLAFNAGYGIFRDELYFIVCGQRLAWGYVDQPPLVPMLAAWSYALSGDWLTGFRLIPALTSALTVAMTTEFARELGGGKYAQWLAGLCVLAGTYFLVIGMFFEPDNFQPMSWLACAWILVKLEKSGDERWWLAFGAVVGFALLSKYMIAFYVVALAIALLATPLRRSLLRPWVYAGAALGLLIVRPNILWQQSHGWPFIELGEAGSNGKNVVLSPLSFFTQQILIIGPLTAPVWLSALWAGVRKPQFAVSRAVPIAYVLLFAFFVATHGKAYYLGAIYPALFAMGAMAIERWVANRIARGAAFALIAAVGLVLLPIGLPVMSEQAFIRYSAAIGLSPSSTASENLDQSSLPQYYADEHGWPQFAAQIAKVYNSLPAKDRAKAVFAGTNYGEAAAIDIYGRRLGMPPAISGHNNYWLWGTHGNDCNLIIEIGGTREHALQTFKSVELAGYTDLPYAMPYENHQPIWIKRGLRMPIQEVWPKAKRYM